jgi:Membrane bound beta barrel domain (DUF5777)
MKFKINKSAILQACTVTIIGALMLTVLPVAAQDEPAAPAEKKEAPKPKPVKNTFQSVWIIDNQTVLVPVKGTFEMDIMHRFGTVDKGYDDFWGFFAPSNIRLGVSYVPVNRLNIGIGVAKTTAAILPRISKPQKVGGPAWDASLKYSIITQTKGLYPVSVSYYTNVGLNTKKDPLNEVYRDTSENGKSTEIIGISTDRFTYFHQLLIARKINDKLSIQVAPSLSHQNAVNGYFTQVDSATLKIEPEMKNTHFAVAFMARYKLTKTTSVMINYDQPITKHAKNNPNPNLSFGLEFNTSSHSFQLFFTNYYFLTPQANNLYNSNSPFDYTNAEGNKVNGGKFLIGFNITRLWNY